MKLDESAIKDIMRTAIRVYKDEMSSVEFWEYLHELDLVFKPGDSSQSVLVENKCKYNALNCTVCDR